MPLCRQKGLLHCLAIVYMKMSVSRHFPSPTQTIRRAQQSPPSRLVSKEDHSIIVISSSPDDRPTSHPTNLPTEISSADESDPFELWAPLPRPEDTVEIIDKEEFTRLIGNYKYKTKPLKESANIPRDARLHKSLTTRKTSLDSFLQECKPLAKTVKNRVKPTLTTRVALPAPKSTPVFAATTSTPVNNDAAKQQSSFFTTWAAAQAPATRGARATSRKKAARKKKSDVQVVLLSPKSGQESVRKRAEGKLELDKRLGAKRDSSGGSMWDASNRGFEGELYDCDGSMVFSQELRTDSAENPLEVLLRDVVSSGEDVQVMGIETVTETVREIVDGDVPARRRGVALKNVEDGMPPYSTFTLVQLQNEVKKFGFKASRSKPGMVSILEECWKATQQPLKQHLAPLETPTSSSLPVDLSSPAIVRRMQLRISQTIKDDPDQSVYCGILRYEPVVIDDLVQWLKKRSLDVPELVVRGWCDKEGVCCVGQDSLQGGGRIRY